MRYALYFTPDRNHPLTMAAAGWLGRDAFSGAEVPMLGALSGADPDATGLEAAERTKWTAEPRRYGFHATLVAPFRLKSGLDESDVVRATATFAAASAPLQDQRLTLARLDRFLALVPAASSGAVETLAGIAVDHFNDLRAPLSEQDIVRRNPDRLTERQRAYLDRYGYPYVKDEFRFHMTLTGPVSAADSARIEPVLHRVLAPALEAPIVVETVAVFVEPEPGAPFTVHSTYCLGADQTGKIARHAP
jgi:putative phosphonate metabolism protein